MSAGDALNLARSRKRAASVSFEGARSPAIALPAAIRPQPGRAVKLRMLPLPVRPGDYSIPILRHPRESGDPAFGSHAALGAKRGPRFRGGDEHWIIGGFASGLCVS